MYEADNKALLDTVEVTLYGKGGGRELTLQGEKGTIDTEKRNFVLSNDTQPLEVELKGGYTVYTNHLAWTESTGELRTDEPVTIVGRGMVVQGQGLVGSIDSEEFQVQRNVHVQVTP
jgi:LPS export ABC transporter protein LptC